MNTNTNESLIATLTNAANKRKDEEKGRDALAATQAQNNKSASGQEPKEPEKSEQDNAGKRRNVYFSKKSLTNLSTIEDMDGVGMSAAVQAALYMFANASDKKREQVYRDLKIKCNFDD